MKTSIELKAVKKLADKGGVAKIQGFHEKYIFDYDWLKPNNKRYGKLEYSLVEGNYYLIKLPFHEGKYFAKVVNGQIVDVQREEVKDHLSTSNKNGPKSKKEISVLKDLKLSDSLEFILDNLDEAFLAQQTSNEGIGISKGMIITTFKYAVQKGLQKEFVFIRDSLKEEQPLNEIRKALLAKKRSPKPVKPVKVFKIEKYEEIFD
jgi:hypothetical protein